MSSHGDLALNSDKNETDKTCDPITRLHVSEAKARDLVQLKISRRSGFNRNQSRDRNKISISTIPHDELEEVKGSISGKSVSNSPVDGVFMITLAGENLGAHMAISDAVSSPPAAPYVNNNVQSINNSQLHESSCVARDPGVHLEIVSSREDLDLVNYVPRKEPNLKERRGLNLNQNQERRPEKEPRVRRRCLRALFMESDSDIEDTGKPRRHGCRFKCDDKRERDGGGGVGGGGTSSKVRDQ